ncbi:MAG TPA: phosphoribosyltransferase family protein [Steroidobacteraceae bacterium]|nr:phosphoribosyltransferase family protein [Steroidobacteraceae bacterium]
MTVSLRLFADRRAAGRELARAVGRLRLSAPVVVLGLPRGGVPVAFEVARALHAPLDVMVVRKVGMPGQPELALGAIAAGAVTVRQPLPFPGYGPDAEEFAALAARERGELERREQLYRAGRAPLELTGKTVVLVDDGLATGATMLAAVRAARKAGAAAVVAAAPVASGEAAALIGAECDSVAIVEIPPALRAVGEWYEDFGQTEDREVCELLRESARVHGGSPGATAS